MAEKSIIAQRLKNNGVEEFSIDGDYFIVSIIDFNSETNEQKKEFYAEKATAITTPFRGEGEKIGTNRVKDIQNHSRKSKYVGARNAGDEQSQTREYDRSDLFEAQSPNIISQSTGEQGARNLDQVSKAFNEGIEAVAKLANEYNKEFGIDSLRVNFNSQLSVAEKSIIAQRLKNNGVEEFSIDGDYFIVSIIDFNSETNEQKKEFYDKTQAAITTPFRGVGERVGTNRVKDIQNHFRKSKYVGTRNEGDEQSQTREYDRSDLFEAQSPNINFQINAIEQELQQIKAQAIANGTFMKAPNGKKSNLTEEQWVAVRTERFKNWFGDWINDPENASKVVDENGEPLVVYHGTEAEFTEFEPTKPNFYQETEGWYFFTDKKESAKTFGKNVMPVFLNIDNPTIETTGHFNTWNLYDDEAMLASGMSEADILSNFDNKKDKEIAQDQINRSKPYSNHLKTAI